MEIYEVLKRDRAVAELFEQIHKTIEDAEKTRKDLCSTLRDQPRARARRAGGVLHAAAGLRRGPRDGAQSARGARRRRVDLQRRRELSGRSIGRIAGESGSEKIPLGQVAPGQRGPLETVGTGRIQAELGFVLGCHTC